MIFETTKQGGNRLYTKAECEQLRKELLIPKYSAIWLGRFSDTGLLALGTDLWLINEVRQPSVGQAITLSIDHLAIQVISVHVGGDHDELHPLRLPCRPGLWDQCLIQIYPLNRTLNWPPPVSFVPVTDGNLTLWALRDRWKIGIGIKKSNPVSSK